MEYKRRAKSPFHAAYSLFHDAIIKKGCVVSSGEVSLPYGWDESSNLVSVKYIKDSKPMEVKCLLMDNVVVINVSYNNQIKSQDFDITDYILNYSNEDKSYETKNIQNFERKVYENILDQSSEPKPATSTAQNESPRPPPPRVGDPLRDDRFQPRAPPIDPFGVGAGDLDPFGRRGGGMFMELPPRHPRLPGARFDPIGPGGFGPDNDELPPPGRGRRNMFDHDDVHDMFM